MRAFTILVSVGLPMVGILTLGASHAFAGASCSSFGKIKSYDASAKAITIEVDKKIKERKFFPKPEGAPTTSKIPAKCKSKVLKQDSFAVKPTGGRMSITQVRENFSGKMLNDTNENSWVPTKLQELATSQATVLLVFRQPVGGGKKAPYGVTTVYLPISEAETAEIARLDAQAVDE
jgi:hypothetical protein